MKQFAEILEFVLKFDELKVSGIEFSIRDEIVFCDVNLVPNARFQMKTPAIQNDFSYYRRVLTRYRITQEEDGEVQLHMQNMNNDLANRMSLFYANATPMLRVLSETTSKFVAEVSYFFRRM